MTVAFPPGWARRSVLWIAAVVTVFGLVCIPAAVLADTYALDDGVIDGSFSQTGAYYANRFVLTSTQNQLLRAILIKKPEADGYVPGTADVYLWDDDGEGGLPGTVLGSVTGVAVPQGNDWVEVSFTDQSISLQPNSVVYAGFMCNGNKALYDAGGGAGSFRRIDPGGWAQFGWGDLMVRMTTTVLAPSSPTIVKISPFNPTLGDTLTANVSGSLAPDGAPPESIIEYEYQWRSRTDNTMDWGAWVDGGQTVPPGDLSVKAEWQLQARGGLNGYFSPWTMSDPVVILGLTKSTTPADGSMDVNRMGSIVVDFRWAMVESCVYDKFTVSTAEGTPVTGIKTWTSRRRTLVFQPVEPLAPSTTYVCTIGAGSQRVTGGAITEPVSFSFTTDDHMAVTGALPTGTSVLPDSNIEVTCDRPVREGTVTIKSFRITPSVSGTRTVTDNRIIFDPSSPLQARTTYYVAVGATVRGTDGQSLGVTYQWSFRTAAAAAAAPALQITAIAAPGEGQTTPITVNLSAAAEVTAEVSNISGRLVATLPARSLPSGVSTLLWNGKSNLGTAVPSGDYLLRVKARAEDGSSGSALARFSR
ncbi:MAG: Ig-like domain-containing protein [Armatimonadia bacterium]